MPVCKAMHERIPRGGIKCVEGNFSRAPGGKCVDESVFVTKGGCRGIRTAVIVVLHYFNCLASCCII